MREIKTLNAALQAYMDRPPSPPPLVPAEIILNMIEEPLLDAVREDIRTLLLQLRAEVQHTVFEGDAEVYQAVWSKLALTLRMVEALARQMDLEDGELIPAS